MSAIQIYLNFFIQHGPFSSSKTQALTALALLIMATLVILNRNKWTAREKLTRLMVWIYLYLILLFTFLARSRTSEFSYNLLPFWSYLYIWSSSDYYIVLEIIINCLMFIPVGILVPWTYGAYMEKNLISERNLVLLFGLTISISVEIIQLFTKTGYFEWDDIIHNMIGLIFGYGLYLWLKGKKFSEVHRFFLPAVGVGIMLLICIL